MTSELCRAAARGDLKDLRRLFRKGVRPITAAAVTAALCGWFECLQALVEEGCPITPEIAKAAATNDHTECLEYMCERECGIDRVVGLAAVANGNLASVEVLHNHGCKFDSEALYTAVGEKHFACVVFIIEVIKLPIDTMTAMVAAGSGSVQMLKYILDKGYPPEPTMTTAAAAGGHLTSVMLLNNVAKKMIDAEVTTAAASSGHIPTLEYVIAEGGLVTLETFQEAAGNGHLDVVKLLLKLNIVKDPTPTVFDAAAEGGHLAIMELVYEDARHALGPHTAEAAAMSGSMAALKFVEAHGIALDASTVITATQNGHVLMAIYAFNATKDRSEGMMISAATEGYSMLMKHFHDNGVPWSKLVSYNAASHGNLDCLAYACENGCEVHSQIIEHLGHLRSDKIQACVSYARMRGCPEPPPGSKYRVRVP